MTSHYPGKSLTALEEAPITPPPSPPATREEELVPLSPRAPIDLAKLRKGCASNRTVDAVIQIKLGNHVRSLFQQGPEKTANQSEDAFSLSSSTIIAKLQRLLDGYTPWQFILILAFAFYTATLFRALAGVGYVPNNGLQHRHGSSSKEHLYHEAHTTSSSLSISSKFRLLSDAVENVAPMGDDPPPDRLASLAPTNTQQRGGHRMRAGARKKSIPQSMESDMSDELVAPEEADISKLGGFAHATPHDDPHRRIFTTHGRLTEYPLDVQSRQVEMIRQASS